MTTTISDFEMKFTNYLYLSENNLLTDSSYSDLFTVANILYSKFSEKDTTEWLKSEIAWKYDKNYFAKPIFSASFFKLYNKTCIKFDLISDFLNKHKKKDIVLSKELLKMFIYFKEEEMDEIYTPFKIISSLIFYVKKDKTLVSLIDNCLPFLEEIAEYDQTILLTIIAFIESRYDSNELEEVRKKSIYF